MLRILIVDDEVSSGNILKLLIEKFISSPKEICYSNKPEEALMLLQTFKPSLVMLDIEMPGMNGFDFLNKAMGADFDVIFTTAFDQYAIKAIRFSALDYLLKPIDNVELQNAINRHIIKKQAPESGQKLLVTNLLNNLEMKEPENFKLALSTSEGISFFEPAEIMYCEAVSNYTRFIFVKHKPILISKTLREYEDLLEDFGFTRIHKSYLVNRKYITKIDREGMLWMTDGKPLTISRRKREVVLEALKNN
ncbi:MAG: LytTR family DNA-binding domain-containing protein [Ferruginibacter sp.]